MLFTDSENGPLLRATRCRDCDYIDFPAQVYGCRQCGSFGASLEKCEIGAEGSVYTSATVHAKADGLEAAFTVAVVELHAGPTTRVEMVDTQPLSPGTRVTGVIDRGKDITALKFQKSGE